VEHLAVEKLIALLPEELKPAYREAMREDPLVKAADKLSAYVKCIAERRAGNDEFLAAEKQTRAALERMALPEVDYFLERFVPAFEQSLDEFDTM
jgi:5'-deoxynucleotidase